MVQAARSGVQNIAEGSVASGTSKKMELKLTNVARASLEELRLDYEDYLRQKGLVIYPPDYPVLVQFKIKRFVTQDEFIAWVEAEYRRTRTDIDKQGQMDKAEQSMSVSASPCKSMPKDELAANATLSLLNICCYFLDRQLASQALAFEQQGGFTERLYSFRKESRKY
jgi:four helix bundle suffix protein